MKRNTIEQLANWIAGRQEIALVCHVSPDGDTLGSALSLWRALLSLGKKTQVFCASSIPEMYSFLPGIEQVSNADEIKLRSVLCVDVASRDRMGKYEAILGGCESACIGHHGTNEGYCDVNVVEGGASATGVVVVKLLDALGISMDREMATCLYAAISSDTGRFMYSLTNAEALRAGARCLEQPIDVDEIGFWLFRRRTLARNKLLAYALNHMFLTECGRIAVIELPQSAYEESGAASGDAEGIVNYGIETSGVEVAIQAKEQNEKQTKFSLRSRGALDVSKAAARLGGGGHANAAGVTIDLPMDQAVAQVLEEIRAQMKIQAEA